MVPAFFRIGLGQTAKRMDTSRSFAINDVSGDLANHHCFWISRIVLRFDFNRNELFAVAQGFPWTVILFALGIHLSIIWTDFFYRIRFHVFC